MNRRHLTASGQQAAGPEVMPSAEWCGWSPYGHNKQLEETN